MAEQLNPLALIGGSNDTTLDKRFIQQQKDTNALQRGLEQLDASGRNERALAGINNESLEERTLYALGLSGRGVGGEQLQDRLGRLFQDTSDKTQSEVNKNDAGAFLRRAQAGARGIFTPGATGRQIQNPDRPVRKGLPISAEAAKLSVPALESDTKNRTKTKRIIYAPGVGFSEVEVVGETSQKAKSPGSPENAEQKELTNDRVNQIHANATKALTAAVADGRMKPFTTIEVIGLVEGTNDVILSIDGGPPQTFPATKKK